MPSAAPRLRQTAHGCATSPPTPAVSASLALAPECPQHHCGMPSSTCHHRRGEPPRREHSRTNLPLFLCCIAYRDALSTVRGLPEPLIPPCWAPSRGNGDVFTLLLSSPGTPHCGQDQGANPVITGAKIDMVDHKRLEL